MQNVTEQIKVASNLKGLWQYLLPDRQLPPNSQFVFWAGEAPENTVCYAVNRGVRKSYKMQQDGTPMTDDHLVKYISGVIQSLLNGREERSEALRAV
jgi:hypothetical protein